jgi:hypothetical protein
MRRLRPILIPFLLLLIPTVATAAPSVWAIDDGEKVKRDATALPFATGTDNPVWQPGQPISLFAMRNETVALQIVIAANGAALDGVTVDLDVLASGADTLQNATGATDPSRSVGRLIERFVEHQFEVKRVSSTKGTSESLGWAAGSGPPATAWTGFVPDALIPVEVAPTWDAYPMHIAAGQNGVVWIDVTVPAGQAPGTYAGNVVVQAAGAPVAMLPIQLTVLGATLPDLPLATMFYYDRDELDRRIGGGDAAEQQLWQLYHRHRISALHGATDVAGVDAALPALDGSLFTAANGYDGPGIGAGDGILSLGTYGDFGAPDATNVMTVEAIADHLQQKGLFATTDVFLYAADESCGDSVGGAWKSAIAGSANANVKKVRVGWTCSDDPSGQPVDVPIVAAQSYDAKLAATARAAGKKVWIYNGYRPSTGTFFTDSEAISTRVNGWIAALYGIERWFYWETTFWYDGNSGGKGPYDPFVSAETFHNSDGDECQGDGVLVYPGKQIDQFTTDSVGFVGVLPSIRLKNVRRGIEDAGYYQLAHAADPAGADAIAKGLIPSVLADAQAGNPPSYSPKGKPYFDARKALAQLIPQSAPPPSADGGSSGADAAVPGGDTDGGTGGNVGGGGGGSNGGNGSGGGTGGCSLSAGGRAPGAALFVVLLALLLVAARRRAT